MHARNRTWMLGSDPVERCRQRTMNVEGGDGSTLSLDFTTGVLDSRLTFTRNTNATFINSQGYVEWANSNMYWNTAFEGLSGTNPSLTSSGWSYGGFTGGNAVFNGDGTVTITTTTADRRAIFRSTGFTGNGLRVVASVDVTISSGSIPSNQMFITGSPVNSQHYVNGVLWNSAHPLWSGSDILPINTPFNLSYVTDSAIGSSTSIYFGIGCQSTGFAGSATFSNPRWTMWNGSGTVPYYPNTSATNNSTTDRYKGNDYQGPRFDYDPTTLTPRGLLIEGAASNVTKYSEKLNEVSVANAWYGANLNTPTVPAGAPNSPYGTTLVSWKLVANTVNGFHGWRQTTTFTAENYTFSFWAKAAEYDRVILSDLSNSRGACTFVLTGNGTATAIAGSVTPTNPTIVKYGDTGWYRCSFTMLMAANSIGWAIVGYPAGASTSASGVSYTGDDASGVYVTMVQIEVGSGASSYIPTGASAGSRAADSCVMTGTNFSSWFAGATEGVIYAEYERPRKGVGADHYLVGTVYAVGTFIGSYVQTSTLFPLAAISPGGGFRVSNVSVAAVTPTKQAAKWFNTNNVLVVANGVVGITHPATSGTPSFTMFSIGSSSTSGTAATGDWLNSCISRIKFWPTALPNAQLQSLTT